MTKLYIYPPVHSYERYDSKRRCREGLGRGSPTSPIRGGRHRTGRYRGGCREGEAQGSLHGLPHVPDDPEMGCGKIPQEKGSGSQIGGGSLEIEERRNTLLSSEFERAESFGELFTLVKRAVKNTLGVHRMGLMLYLGDLPIRVGGFHPIGTNEIIINRRLMKTPLDARGKANIFTLLLHEYLHSLGYIEEREVRALTYQISAENFGNDHPVTRAAVTGPWPDIDMEKYEDTVEGMNLELIRDFERVESHYII